jgi:hypothetical protein
MERMIIFHHYKHDYLPFLNTDMIKQYATFIEYDTLSPETISNKSTTIAVTKFTNHLCSTILYDCREMLKYKLIQKKNKFIKIKDKSKSENDQYEAVSDITGTAIPAYYELMTTGTMTIEKKLNKGAIEQFLQIFPDYSYASYFNLQDDMKIENLLKFANMYCCFRSQYIYKAIQIKNYNWINKDQLNACVERVKKHIGALAKYEKSLQYVSKKHSRIVVGQIDCYDKDILWEFKCVKQLNCEHFIQLAVYAFMHRMYYIQQFKNILQLMTQFVEAKNGIDNVEIFLMMDARMNKIIKKINSKYYLMNILSDEIYELQYEKSQVDKMMRLLCDTKFSNNNKTISGKQFVKDMLDVSEEYRC